MFLLKEIDANNFDNFYKLMEQDFCLAERRLKETQLKMLENKKMSQRFIFNDDGLVGYICYWKFDDFLFIEHLAILKELRSKGFGAKFLKEFLENETLPVILEVEREKDIIAIRRIEFYKRLGFNLNKFNYYQPPYHSNGEKVPMYVMSYNKKLGLKDYQRYVKVLKEQVYGIKK